MLLMIMGFALNSSVAQTEQGESINLLTDRLNLLGEVRTAGWEGKKTAEKVREALAGHEANAVAYSLEKYGTETNDLGLDQLCMAILRTFETQTLEAFQRRMASGDQRDPRSLQLLLRWARTTKLPEVLDFAIEPTIDSGVNDIPQWDVDGDVDALRRIPVERDFQGAPYRTCDMACNLIVDMVDNVGKELGRKPPMTISGMDNTETRESKRAALKEWWRKNSAFLQWSAGQEIFVVNEDARRTGIPVVNANTSLREDQANTVPAK
jgi:hypothetical protein